MTWEWGILLIYTLALGFIFFFSLIQLNLVFNFWTKREKLERETIPPKELKDGELPFVTIQLPLFNEKYVVERLIDCMVKLDYPKDKFEIQVLDDSTDETTEIVQRKEIEYQAKGVNIQLIRRPERTGYKAGALKYGLELAKGKYIAIFDADFLPNTDFLRKMIPYLESDDKLGVVQSRWGHLNEDYSMLTKLQSFALDAHFTIEQIGRNSANHFINFNGTGGVWRKTCIYDAGNWEADTLTEDLDLSYRAQMKGWKFRYFKEVESPAELPATMNALKAQQHRWTKGAAETAVKHLRNLWKSDAKLSTKIHGSMHLLNSAIFLAMIVSGLVSVPVVFVKQQVGDFEILFAFASLFFLSLFSLVIFYGTSYFSIHKFSGRNLFRFLIAFPLFLAVSMGLSLRNALAVFEGYIGKKTPFVRTPKFDITTEQNNSKWKQNIYRHRKVNALTWVEGLLALYFGFGLWLGFYYQDYGLTAFHSMITFGYVSVFLYSFKHAN